MRTVTLFACIWVTFREHSLVICWRSSIFMPSASVWRQVDHPRIERQLDRGMLVPSLSESLQDVDGNTMGAAAVAVVVVAANRARATPSPRQRPKNTTGPPGRPPPAPLYLPV